MAVEHLAEAPALTPSFVTGLAVRSNAFSVGGASFPVFEFLRPSGTSSALAFCVVVFRLPLLAQSCLCD